MIYVLAVSNWETTEEASDSERLGKINHDCTQQGFRYP